MSEPFLAEIKMVGFDFPMRGWAFCDGQILPINQNQSLYSLIGTTYGGDGRTSFALPDLRGRTPMHVGGGHSQGQKGGAATVTLSATEMPAHTHQARAASADATTTTPTGALSGQTLNLYRAHDSANSVAMRPGTLADAGGGQAHQNMQPSAGINFCIALQGLFPSRN